MPGRDALQHAGGRSPGQGSLYARAAPCERATLVPPTRRWPRVEIQSYCRQGPAVQAALSTKLKNCAMHPGSRSLHSMQ